MAQLRYGSNALVSWRGLQSRMTSKCSDDEGYAPQDPAMPLSKCRDEQRCEGAAPPPPALSERRDEQRREGVVPPPPALSKRRDEQRREGSVEPVEEAEEEEKRRLPSRSHSPAASVDWPLSREEKKDRVLQLYDRDARAADDLLKNGENSLDELRKELRRLRRALPPPKKSSRGSEDDNDSTPEITPRPPSQMDHINEAVHRAIARATNIVGSLLDDGPSADEDGLEFHRRAKSEGAPIKEEPQPAARRRRRSRPEAPRRVSFADDPQKSKTLATEPPKAVLRHTVILKPEKERGRTREVASHRQTEPVPAPPKPKGILDFI